MLSEELIVYKLCVYVPSEHLETLKQALFDAGAGRIGDYDSCCWQVLGEGQFRPLEGSDPFTGEQGKVALVSEYRVEMVVGDDCIVDVVRALKDTHPYETPAYEVWRLDDF